MGVEARTAQARVRVFAIGAAAAVHALLLVLLVWRLGTQVELHAVPVINVELTPAWRHSARRLPRQAAAARAASPRAPSKRPVPPHHAPQAPTAAVEASGMDEPTGGPPPVAVRPVLRGLLGCDHAALLGLTAEERRRCLDQLPGEARRAVAARLNLDLRGAFGRPAEPYLARKPKKGCKPAAAGDVDPMGKEGPIAGLNCAWSF
jgi:hypothetical protein